jgi:hypothetical protein
MARKITVRQAVISTVATTAGFSGGAVVDAMVVQFGQGDVGAGRVAALLIGIWTYLKIDEAIEQER